MTPTIPEQIENGLAFGGLIFCLLFVAAGLLLSWGVL